MLIIRKFDADTSESLNTITKVLIELQLSDVLEEVTTSSTPSTTKEGVAA